MSCRFIESIALMITISLSSLLVFACGSTAQRQPPGQPPTPITVSMEEPGGDAHDPHWGALTRQLVEPWGRRNDRDDQVSAPIPDWQHWKRVRYWGFEHFTGFRYGDDHHVIAVVFVQDVPPGAAIDSASCMRRFEDWVRPQIRSYDVHFGTFAVSRREWRGQPLIVKFVDGAVALGFSNTHFSAAWAAYAAYPHACLVYAMAVPWRDQGELARKVRDRWVSEGFQQMNVLTHDRPYRKSSP